MFVAQESDSELKANTALIQSVFLHTLENGMQSENIRTRLIPVLEKQNVPDEEIIHQLSLAVASEEDRQKRLQHAGLTKQARVTKLQMEDDERSWNGERLSAKLEQKQKVDNEQIIAAIESLKRDMATLQEKWEDYLIQKIYRLKEKKKGKADNMVAGHAEKKVMGQTVTTVLSVALLTILQLDAKKVETKGLIRETGSSHNWGASSG